MALSGSERDGDCARRFPRELGIEAATRADQAVVAVRGQRKVKGKERDG